MYDIYPMQYIPNESECLGFIFIYLIMFIVFSYNTNKNPPTLVATFKH